MGGKGIQGVQSRPKETTRGLKSKVLRPKDILKEIGPFLTKIEFQKCPDDLNETRLTGIYCSMLFHSL